MSLEGSWTIFCEKMQRSWTVFCWSQATEQMELTAACIRRTLAQQSVVGLLLGMGLSAGGFAHVRMP
jgi:hypothetical protein